MDQSLNVQTNSNVSQQGGSVTVTPIVKMAQMNHLKDVVSTNFKEKYNECHNCVFPIEKL